MRPIKSNASPGALEIIQAGSYSDILQYQKWITKSWSIHKMETFPKPKKNKMQLPQHVSYKHGVEKKKPEIQECVLYDSIYMKLKNIHFDSIWRRM